MHTRLSIRPQMSICPQLVITGRMIQVPSSELEEFINRELENNPALELAKKPAYIKEKLQIARSGYQSTSHSKANSKSGSNHLTSLDEVVERIAQWQSPLENLTEQVLITLDHSDHDLAIKLLHCLDRRGFLVTPLEQLAKELGVSDLTIDRVIQLLHQLEPPGIGARDIRECFLIQCTHLEAEGIDCQYVRRILTSAWSDFLNQRWGRVARKIQQRKKIVEDTCEFMRLNFYLQPLAMLDTSIEADKVLDHADLIICRNICSGPTAYSLDLPGEEEFALKLSTSFQEMLGSKAQEDTGLSSQERNWIKFHLDRASLVIGALRQRWMTLRRIGEYVIQHQIDFLEHGHLYIKPLTRAIVARELNLHESTISRAVSNKIIQIPNGRLIPLSDFFDASLSAKEAIRILLKENSRSLCDREIAEALRGKGVNISRRTVTKYRHEMMSRSSRWQSVAI